jgi:hypothetical protein
MTEYTRINKLKGIITKSLKQKKDERCYFYCLIAVLGIGFIVDCVVKLGWHLLSVERLGDFCSDLITIQTTIATIPIALIALLSNLFSKSYLGISLSSYILNFKHRFFKFQYVFYAEMGLVLASVLFKLLTFYNFIFASLLVSIILICITVKNVYEAYTDLYSIYDEILVYWNCRLLRGAKNYKDLGILFIEDWKRTVNNNLSTEEFELYRKLYFKLIRRILYREQDFRLVNSFTEEIALFLLKHDNIKAKERGFDFVISFYERILKIIRGLKHSANEKDYICLISKVGNEWIAVIKSSELKNININKLGYFSLKILRVALINGNNSDNDSEMQSAYSIAYELGLLFGKQCEQQKKTDLFDEHSLRMNISYDLLENRTYTGFKTVAILNFNFIRGYLLSRRTGFVREYLLSMLRKRYMAGQLEKCIFEVMLIHCYLYYLAYREAKEYASSDEFMRETAGVITDREITQKIYHLFTHCVALGKKSDILNSAVEADLEGTLKSCELVPSNGAIMEGVVRVYFLYVVLLASEISLKSCSPKYNPFDALDLDTYRGYLFESKRKETERELLELSRIFGDDNKNARIVTRFNGSIQALRKKLKESIKENNAGKLKELRDRGTDELIKRELNEQFNRYFENNSGIDGKYCLFNNSIVAYSVIRSTEELAGNFSSDYVSGSVLCLIKKIAGLLISECGIESKKVDQDFADYDSLTGYVQGNKYNLLIGNPYVLLPQKWMHDDQILKKYVDFIDSFEKIDIDSSDIVIATQKGELAVSFNSIDVSISSLSIEEIKQQFIKNSSLGKIFYKYSNETILEFDDENEFIEFMQNEKQKIEIRFNFSVYAKRDTGIEATVFE